MTMKASIAALLLGAVLNSALVSAMTSHGYTGHGLIGYGISMYKPTCAFACHDSVSSSPLTCSMKSDMGGMHMDMGSTMTMPHCFATNRPFLQTVAYCLSTHCDQPVWKLEEWWAKFAVGRAVGQPAPMESFQDTLYNIAEPPNEVLVSGEPLNRTMLVSNEDYVLNYNGMRMFEKMEISHERYGLVVFLSGVIIPIGISLLRFLPWFPQLATRFNSYFITPPAFGTQHKTPIGGFAHVPTRGQAIFVAYLISINVILCAVGIETAQPNAWFPNTGREVFCYVALRTGVISFANIPLLILYAGRNNVLLKLTNWSHDTFLLVHRWVAWIATIQAAVHSAVELKAYETTYSTESRLPYWIWGVVATIGMCVLLPSSVLPLRRKFYELFLAWHVAVSIFVIVGCYLHIIYRFQNQWGYEVWILVSIAIWAFDRSVRVLKLLKNGLKNASVTVIDDHYVRVEVEGVSGSGHAYLYFPTLTWRVWENHPFSVASGMLGPGKTGSARSSCIKSPELDLEKENVQITTTSADYARASLASSGNSFPRVGLTFFLRTQSGLTSLIRYRQTLPVLVESPYGTHEDLSAYPTLIAIVGGVGITAVIPSLRSHRGRVKLYWGARSSGIIDTVNEGLEDVEKEFFIGERMDVFEVLRNEVLVSGGKIAVVVSGPSGMADDARVAVSKLGRGRGVVLKLEEEAFSW